MANWAASPSNCRASTARSAKRNPKSIEICTLLNKPERRKVEIDIAYEGVKIPDEFVVGYGLDYAEKYRNLPFIGILKPSVYGE